MKRDENISNGEIMIKKRRTNLFICLLLLTFTAVGSACSLGTTSAQNPAGAKTVRRNPNESPTPAYQPPKRVSRDVIKTEKKNEPANVKAK
jgi:hypothetical protein